MDMVRTFFFALAIALGVVLAASAWAGIRYSVVDLGAAAANGETIWPRRINSSGEVVVASDTHGYVWRNGVLTDIGNLGGTRSSAYGINDKGQVVGLSYPVQYNRAQLIRWENGTLSNLGNRGYWAVGMSINEAGQIVGYDQPDYMGNNDHAFLWQNKTWKDLGTLGTSAQAWAINNHGQVVGNSRSSQNGNMYRAFLWENDVMTNLGALGGLDSFANDINDRGQIAGRAGHHACIWESGTGRDLGDLGNGYSRAYGINGLGQVVGRSGYTMNGAMAFIWWDGVMLDLNSFIDPTTGWELREARDINDSGQIVGVGQLNGQFRSFLLNPVPEPSGVCSLICGLAAIAWVLRRKAA
jgi:probable HAF family extracellular repeat protein